MQIRTISISDFIITGHIDKVTVGISADELNTYLGPIHQDQQYFFDGGFSVFIDGVEYMVVDNIVEMISLDPHRTNLSLGNDFLITPSTTLSEFIEIVDKKKIGRTIYQKHTFGRQTVLEVGPHNIKASFIKNEKISIMFLR